MVQAAMTRPQPMAAAADRSEGRTDIAPGVLVQPAERVSIEASIFHSHDVPVHSALWPAGVEQHAIQIRDKGIALSDEYYASIIVNALTMFAKNPERNQNTKRTGRVRS
jgi:hypothetical protein